MPISLMDRTADWVVDNQIQSPLYGSLPLEIRLVIFKLAMGEYYDDPIRHDFRIRHDHDGEPEDDGVFDSSVESARFTDGDTGGDETDDGDEREGMCIDPAKGVSFNCLVFVEGDDGEADDAEGDKSEGHDKEGNEDDGWHPEIDGDPGDSEYEMDVGNNGALRKQEKMNINPVNIISSIENHENDESDDDDDWDPEINGDASINNSPPTYSPIHPSPSVKKYHLSWLRPRCLGAPELKSPLILVCRRIYLETRDMVPANFTIHIWSNYAPRETQSEAYDATISLYRHLTPPQRNDITSAHLHCHELFKTGPKCLWSLCAEPPNILRRIEHLRISIVAPSIVFPSFWDPYFPDLGFNVLRANMASTADFGRGPPPPESPDAEWEPPVRWNEHAWAEAFRYLPRLKTLVMDFDTDPGGVPDVREVVEWASRVWRFPLGPRPDGFTYLSAQGNPVEKMSWRGTPCFYRPCEVHTQGLTPDGTECAWSSDQIHLIEKGYGERMYTWTVTWTARIGKPWDPSSKGGSSIVKEHVGSGGPPTGKTTWDGTETI